MSPRNVSKRSKKKRGEREFIFNQVHFTRRLQSAPFFLPANIIKRALNFCGHVNKIEIEIAEYERRRMCERQRDIYIGGIVGGKDESG